jgi:hypothetical protein
VRWRDVSLVHKARGGVYVKNGRIVSVLVAPDSPYGNLVTKRRIRYGFSPYADPNKILAFESAISERYPFRVFRKQAINAWEDLGFFEVVSVDKELLPNQTPRLLYFNLIYARAGSRNAR